jgi:CRP-like cAMP-binding protein
MNLFIEGDQNIDGVYLILSGEFEVLKTIDFEGID